LLPIAAIIIPSLVILGKIYTLTAPITS